MNKSRPTISVITDTTAGRTVLTTSAIAGRSSFSALGAVGKVHNGSIYSLGVGLSVDAGTASAGATEGNVIQPVRIASPRTAVRTAVRSLGCSFMQKSIAPVIALSSGGGLAFSFQSGIIRIYVRVIRAGLCEPVASWSRGAIDVVHHWRAAEPRLQDREGA